MNSMLTQHDFWFDVGSLQEIPVRGARRVKTPRREIAIFRTASDEVFALENRCPHKGTRITIHLPLGPRAIRMLPAGSDS